MLALDSLNSKMHCDCFNGTEKISHLITFICLHVLGLFPALNLCFITCVIFCDTLCYEGKL